MQSNSTSSHSLQTLHEILSLLGDVFCAEVCEKCRWSISTFYFHLHNPGHLKKEEQQKINRIMRSVLTKALAEAPQIKEPALA